MTHARESGTLRQRVLGKFDRLAVDTHIREVSSWREDGLADVERRGHAHRFDRHVHALAAGQLQHALDRLAVGAVDQRRSPEVFCHAEPIVVEIDHQYHSWRIELRRQQDGQTDRAGTDDGFNFRGRGLSQVTGRDGYAKLGQATGLDLVNNPGLVNDPAHALECGVADFVLCGCLPYAEQGDVVSVTRHLNGGLIGLAERERWTTLWRQALAA